MRAPGRVLSGLIALCWVLCATPTWAEEAPAPEEPAPTAPAVMPAEAPAAQPAATPAPTPAPPPAPTPEALAALAQTIRFLDAFPGSPVQRDALLSRYATAMQAQAGGRSPGVDIWAEDTVGEWMHGPVPTRITPTMMLLAWQKVMSEHYAASLLTFAPRLRAWSLRVLERTGRRLAAVEKSADAGDAQAKLERSRLVVLAQSFRRAVLLLPGPTDRTAGLPDWVLRLPADTPGELLDAAHADAGVLAGLTPWFSDNLAAEQVFQALTSLQLELVLRGEQRMAWGSLTIGLLLEDREDSRLLQDLNRWIEEYSPSAAANNDFLSLAAMSQAPRDPKAREVWQAELSHRRKLRLAALTAAGCMLPPGPTATEAEPAPAAFAEDWRLLAWRSGPLDQLPSDFWHPGNTAATAAQRLRRLQLPQWEALFDADADLDTQPVTMRSAMHWAVRAIDALKDEPATTRWMDWCLLTPVNFVRGPENPAPLRDDEALGPVWVDGEPAFYTVLGQAADAHAAYLQALHIPAPNATMFARLSATLAGWAATDPARTIGTPPTASAMRDLLQARQWLAQWLQIDRSLMTLPRATPVVLRRGQGVAGAEGPGQMTSLRLRWTLNYAVRPASRSGLESPEPTSGPLLTLGLTLAVDGAEADPSGWTPETLQTAVMGPERKGPIRYLSALSVFSPDFDASGLARGKLRVWLARDPEGFQAALEAGPHPRDGDFERLLCAAMTCVPNQPELLDLILKNFPDAADTIYRGLALGPNGSATAVLAALAQKPGHAAAAAYLAERYSSRGEQEDFLHWLGDQPEPEPALNALLRHPHRAWTAIWLDWYNDDLPVTERALLLAAMAPGLNADCEPFHRRVERGLQLLDSQAWYCRTPPVVHDPADPEDLVKVLRLLKANLDRPELQAVAVAGLAISDRHNAYVTLTAFLQDPAQAGFRWDPAYVFLMGTSRVAGTRPEMGRELLRAWVRGAVVGADGKARVPTLDENQTWATAVDLLQREYILTDEDLPALVERYLQEIGADVLAPRMRFPTHGAFATAFAINPERTLDLIATALESKDSFRRDAALAILTTQTRVDALDGARTPELPALENLALRLEGVSAADRQTQTAAWQQWLKLRRGAILDQIRAHLE